MLQQKKHSGNVKLSSAMLFTLVTHASLSASPSVNITEIHHGCMRKLRHDDVTCVGTFHYAGDQTAMPSDSKEAPTLHWPAPAWRLAAS